MTKILVVTGSVRPQSVNQKMVAYVAAELASRSVDVEVADLGELNLPFYDDPLPPSSPDFAPQDEGVKRWTSMIAGADGVVLVTPEYNHTMTPVQLNAVDWIYTEWAGRPVALVGYGWRSGASQAHAAAREILSVNLKANVLDTQANLFFGKDLTPVGDVADVERVAQIVGEVLDELVEVAHK